MFNKVFVDANILIDYIDASRQSHSFSTQTLRYLLSYNIEICTSCDIMTTIYYLHSKTDRHQALLEIEKINQFCKIIHFSNKEVTLTCNVMQEDSAFYDLEDTLQYILAKKEKCDLIVSNDKSFMAKEMPLLSSESFVKQVINA